MTIKHNVVTCPWRFRVTYADGRTEQVTVEAESYNAATLGLPRGVKRYIWLSNKSAEQNEK